MVLTLATNAVVTSLIVYRIWSIQKRTSPYRLTSDGHDRMSHAMWILIESGLVYTLSVIILIATYGIGSNAQLGVKDAVRLLLVGLG